MNTTLRLPIALAAIALAGCGSSGTSSTDASALTAKQSSMVSFADCMRSHGVPNFPDLGDRGMQIQLSSNGVVSVNGMRLDGPAFQTAMQECRTKLPNGGRPPQLTASQRDAMLRFSQCMRAHGVPNFPDPTFSGGGVRIGFGPSSGINPQSPAFQKAQSDCHSITGGGILTAKAAP